MMCQHPIQGRSQCINIATWLRPTMQLFRRCIANRHNNGRLMMRLKSACNAEVDQFNFVMSSDHNIRRFEITEDNGRIQPMKIGKHTTELPGPIACTRFGNSPRPIDTGYIAISLQNLAQRITLDKIHHQVMLPIFQEKVAHTWNTGMVEV